MTCSCYVQSGGPFYPVELGRLDGLSSTASSVAGKLPQPTSTLNQMVAMFRAHGLNMSDIVALSGELLTSPSRTYLRRVDVVLT